MRAASAMGTPWRARGLVGLVLAALGLMLALAVPLCSPAVHVPSAASHAVADAANSAAGVGDAGGSDAAGCPPVEPPCAGALPGPAAVITVADGSPAPAVSVLGAVDPQPVHRLADPVTGASSPQTHGISRT